MTCMIGLDQDIRMEASQYPTFECKCWTRCGEMVGTTIATGVRHTNGQDAENG